MSADGMMAVQHDPFGGTALSARLPITEAQREIWLAVEAMPECALAYNECGTLTLRGALDTASLLRALQTLTDRHEVLSASFSPDGDWMCVAQSTTADIVQRDISADPSRLLAEAEEAAVSTAFDLERGPLIRWQLLRESDTVHYLIRAAHHIIVDGWTSWVLWQELGKLYSGESLDPAPRFGDFAQIDRDFIQSAEGQTHSDFWLKTLEQPPNGLALPHDKPRPAQRSFDAERVDVELPAELVARLRKLGATHGASLVATTLAAFVATLHRQSGQEDLIIGLAAAAQSFHQQKNLAGHAVNLLPLRFKPQAAQRFSDLLAQTRAHVLDAFDHQGVSFGGIVPKLRFERDASRPPLVPIMFNIDVRSGDVVYQGLQSRYRCLLRKAEIFELFVNMVDDGKSLLLECSYNCNLFSAAAIRARMAEYGQILEAVCADPQQTLAQLELLTAEARAQLARFNATQAPIPALPLHEAVAAQASVSGAQPAVHAEDGSWTYAELQARVEALASAFAAAGAGPGGFVGVCLPRTRDLTATLLAVLRTGAAYVPLDPEFPPERLAYYLEDSGAQLCVTQNSLRSHAPWPCPVLCLESAQAVSGWPAPTVPASAPAYVLYTSGSTGKPKGVLISHHNVSNCLASMAREPGLTAQDVVLGVSTYAFDISVFDLFLPFITGAQLVLASRDQALDGEALARLLRERHVSFMQCTPSTWRLLLQSGWEGSKTLRAGSTGEPLPRDLAELLLPKVGELWNLYGPTETTIWSTLYRVTDGHQPILIGKPLANTQCHLLSPSMDLLPPGVAGELWIGGDGVGLGYHRRPELTAEKFVTHPTLGRLYRTGDLARLTPEGIECLGRVDFQIKLRGFRIELGEIEYALSRVPAIGDSVVLVRERTPGDPRLVAFLAGPSRDAIPSAGELREMLRGFLPPYMIPQHFSVLDALPRLPNGKLDRKALPDPFASHAVAAAKVPPRTEAEKSIAALWQEALGQVAIGIDDRLGDLGGHSLMAVKIAGQLQKRYGIKLPLRAVLMDPLSALAARCAPGETAAAPPLPEIPSAPSTPGLSAPVRTTRSESPGLLTRLWRSLGGS